jgi:GNAT superfamily N-acetyltransferase
MRKDLTIYLTTDMNDFFDLAALKKIQDSEFLGEVVSKKSALEKILKMKSDGCDFWLARIPEDAVGYAIGIGQEDRTYESKGLLVVPKYRRHGIGTLIKQAQIDYARSQGYTQIWTEIGGDNVACRGLHEKMRFEIKKIDDLYIARMSLK